MKYVALLLLTLTGCQTPGAALPPGDPVVVKVPVQVSCVDEVPPTPRIHSDMELLAMSDYQFINAIHADRLALRNHAAKLSAILSACVADSAIQ